MTSPSSLPAIDVIVPCYQYGRYLASCVASLLDQEGVRVRILIVDDASSDDTEEIGRRLQRENAGVEYRRHEQNRGSIATFNEGLDWVTAEYMLLISADDYALPGAFRRAISLMERHPGIGLTLGKTVDLEETSGREVADTLHNRLIEGIAGARQESVLSEVEFLKLLAEAQGRNIVRTPTTIVRTSVQKKVGLYRPDLIHTADLDMWLRFAAAGDVGILNDYQAVYRMHGANLSNTYFVQFGLPDLVQRRTAYEDYFATSIDRNMALETVGREIRRAIGLEACHLANWALDEHGRDASDQLARLALDTYPGVRWTSRWLRLRLRRRLKLRTWRTLSRVLRWLGLQQGQPENAAVARDVLHDEQPYPVASRSRSTRMVRALPGSNTPGYSVLIRTYNSQATLPETLRSIRQQSLLPAQYVFVDSGSTDNTANVLPEGSVLHPYQGEEFNYSDALNQGVRFVTSDYVLIISSHTTLLREDAVESALALLESDMRIGAAYFWEDRTAELTYDLIGKEEFDGFNGLWNTCSLIRVELLRKRPFRSEVFAAEDQEWARWLIHEQGKVTARIWGAGMTINNPRKNSLRKRLNEYVSVACYSNRALLKPTQLVRLGYRAAAPYGGLRTEDRLFQLAVLWQLICCRFRKPTRRSRYF